MSGTKPERTCCAIYNANWAWEQLCKLAELREFTKMEWQMLSHCGIHSSHGVIVDVTQDVFKRLAADNLVEITKESDSGWQTLRCQVTEVNITLTTTRRAKRTLRFVGNETPQTTYSDY